MSFSFLKNSVLAVIAVATLQVSVDVAHAKPNADETDLNQIFEMMKRLRYEDPLAVLDISEVYSDRLKEQEKNDTNIPAIAQNKSVNEIVDHLTVSVAPFAIVKGQPGSGKTAVINDALLAIVKGALPSAAHDGALGEAIVIKTSMRNFMPGMKNDMAFFVDVSRKMGQKMGRKVVLYFNECQFASDYVVSVLRDEADRQPEDAIPIILEVDDVSYGRSIKGHPSFTSIAPTVQILSPKAADTIEILKQRRESFAQRYHVEITDEVAAALVDIAPDFRRDVAEPRRSIQLMEKFMIAQRRKAPTASDYTPTKLDLYRFVAEQANLPVLPQNEEEFATFMNNVKTEIKKELIGQDHMVDGLVDQFVAALTSRTRQHSIALMMGPTGVGKTLIGEKLVEKFYGDKTRFLELDMTQFSDEASLTALFGASNGYISSDKEKGALCDFFDGPGKNGGIVVMNEIEEMSGAALTRFMEMFDKGEFRGGDGKVRYVGRTMFILTSNKNADKILSYEAIRGMAKAELQRRLANITQDQMKKAFTEKSSYTEDSQKQVKSAVLERVDRIYFASPLLKEDAVRVAKLEIDRFVREYEKQGTSKLIPEPSLQQVITDAFYNEALGSRQIRTNVTQYFSRATQAFKAKYGYNIPALEISASMHPSLKTVSYITVKDPATGNELTIDGPKIPLENRLLDKEFRDRLMNLEKNINTEIFGQPESVKAVVSALISRYLKAGKGRAAAGFLFGVTGSGKSEIAKLVAKYLFDSPKAVGIFDMGNVQTEAALWNIFSPPKGIIGSDQPGEFETFLIQNPDGGVLLFDEMSNAGNGDPKLKETIAKQFYTMMEEGYWKSPSGKYYDVRNHLIIFTGNDGEEIFKGMTSDTFLDEAYKEAVKKPDMIRQLLVKAGFTQAFIGRLSFIQLMRPTLTDTKILIARKMLSSWRDEVQKSQPIDIHWDEELVKEVGLLMFSPTTGARSFNDFISTVMGQLIGQEAMKADWESLLNANPPKRMRIDLSADITKPSRPFFDGPEPDKTEAVLKSTLSIGDRVISTEKAEFTKMANFQPTVHVNVARAVAYHEMGHAVTGYEDVTGHKLIKITIVPERTPGGIEALGYAAYRDVPRQKMVTEEYLVKNAAGLYAGSEAEKMFTGEYSAGRSNDVERVGKLIKRLALDSHLHPDFDGVHAYIDKNGEFLPGMPAALKKRFEDYVKEMDEKAKNQAKETLEGRWHLIDAGARLLLDIGSVNEAQIGELFKQGDALQAEMDALVRSGGWTKEKAAEIGRKIDLEKVKAAGKPKCELELEGPQPLPPTGPQGRH